MANATRAGSGPLALTLAAALPFAAGAQTADPAQPPGDTASGPQQDGLPDVTVTARRRAEDAQRVPASLSVIGGALLDRSYTVNVNQLQQLVPSLTYSSANPRNTAFTIRGLGSSVVAVSQANDGLEPGVGFYVDQVYHARPATAAFDFTDIDRIEVLRGPQGTLFGKNTTAGAINITTRQPSFTPEASEEISYGSFRFGQAKASASGPLIDDTVAYRLSGLVTRRDGVITNVHSGERYNGIGNQAVRGQLLIHATTSLSTRLIADYTNFSNACCAQVPYRVGQSLRPATRQYPYLASQFGYSAPSTNPYDRVTDIDVPVDVRTAEGGVSAITDWILGPVTLTNVAAWRFWTWDAANDRDYTGLPIQLVQHIPSRQDQYSEELRVASNSDHRVGYVAGLYYFRQRITGEPISIYGPAAAQWLIGATTGANNTPVPANLLDGYGTDGHTDFRSTSYAAFGEANLKLTPRLIATGGLRYTRETKNGSYATFVFGGLQTTNTALNNAKLGILRPQSYSAHNAEGNVSGRANLSYRFSDAVFGYAAFARGYKSGGINMSGLPLDAANGPALAFAVVRPELNTNYEIGLKTRAFDRRVVFNIDGFYTRVRDFQATIVDTGPTQTAALRGYLSNIPRVTVKGVEADATALVAPGLTLRASFAYADGRYADYPAGPCPLEAQTSATTACDLTGKTLASLPRYSEVAGVDYTLPVGGGAALILHADSNWRSGYNADSALSRYTTVPAYSVTNGSIALRFADGIELAVFARNLLDAHYIQNVTVQAGNSGLILATPGDPRTVGVTLRAHQ